MINGTYLNVLVHVATRQVLWVAWEIIPEYCYPCLTHRSPTGGLIARILTPRAFLDEPDRRA
jgi:hypothetical protein